MYDLKKISSITQASVSALAVTRPVRGVKRRAEPAINVRSPRLMMGLIFLILLLAYLAAYAQEAANPQPYLTIPQPAGLNAEMQAPDLIPQTGGGW